MTTHIPRFGFAMVLAPLSVPAVFLVLVIVESGFSPKLFDPMGLNILGLITFVSYMGLLTIGLPAYIFLRRIERLRLWSLCLSGAIGAVVVALVLKAIFSADSARISSITEYIEPMAMFAGLGIIVAAVFGLITKTPVK